MRKYKQTKAPELEDGVDSISNLPDPILLLILSRIQSTEEVIRTSILSTRWRYLWTSVPSLNIDYSRGLKPFKKFERYKFQEFVYWVLANKSLDLDSFRLSCLNYYNMLTLGRWIHIAVTKNVKLLDLEFFPRKKSENVELPHCLVTCGSLEILRLFLFGRCLNLPHSTGFPALRVLVLNVVELDNDYAVKSFFESCPLLEDLSLLDCSIHKLLYLCISCPKLKNLTIKYRENFDFEEIYKDKEICDRLVISCPKLVFFMLTGEVASVICFESLYSLKEAVIHPAQLSEWERPLTNEFNGICYVESLSISLYCIAMCYAPLEDVPISLQNLISLPNLKTLKITVDGFVMEFLIPFLICFPDLESLHLIIYQVDRLEDWKLDDTETMRILTRRLKVVEFLGFDGEERKMVVARSLLEHGVALKEMVFSWFWEDKHNGKSMKVMKEISNFHKASSTVKLRSVIESAHSWDTQERLLNTRNRLDASRV